ncbi:MAG: 3-hydroxyacyl-ACP dehydratase FabZ [bacterium]
MTEAQSEFKDLNLNDIKKILPHRYPMLLVDRMVNITKESGVGLKGVTANEPFFQGHFPDQAVMPGVLIVEAMAQAAACFASYVDDIDTTGQIILFMGVEKARFRRPVVPGNMLELHVSIAQRRPPVWRFQGKGIVDGKVVAEANFSAMLAKPEQAAI